MPITEDRKEFTKAIRDKKSSKVRGLLQRNDAKELLLVKDDGSVGFPIHDACRFKVDEACLQLILDAAVEHGIIKQMLEAKDKHDRTCLHDACVNDLSSDSLRLLLEYLSKHADIKKVLEKESKGSWTCLHSACLTDLSTDSLGVLLEYLSKYADTTKMLDAKNSRGRTCLHYACDKNSSIESLRLLISFFPSKKMFENALAAKDNENKRAVDYAERDEIKHLLQDPNCWQNCRLWLLQNHEETFLYALYPNSLEKTCQALQEVTENGLQHCLQRATIMLIALMASPSKFREGINNTDSSAPMSSYFDVVKKGDVKSDYNHWRKNIRFFREFYGHWPPSGRKTATTFEGEGSSSCVIQ